MTMSRAGVRAPLSSSMHAQSANDRRRCARIAGSTRLRSVSEVKVGVETEESEDTYEVNIPKPLGVSFRRGNDGRAYVADVNPARGNIDPNFEVGDRIEAVSASFGSEVWKAENYGQVAYAIRTRSGDLYFKMLRRNGDVSCFEALVSEDQMFRNERAGGNYGAGTKELQRRNYSDSMEAKRKRVEMFEDGLEMFNNKEFEKALITWEDVLGMEPKNYVGDDFSRTTDVYRTTYYNIACCYCKMGNKDAAFEALESALRGGFDNYSKVRNDPQLAMLREDDRFYAIIDKFDEPWINMNAINALKGLFGGNN